MGSRRVNRFTQRQGSTELLQRRNGIFNTRPIQDTQTGFIWHPQGFPIETRRIWFARSPATANDLATRVGIMFDSQLYYPPASLIELTIPVRDRIEKFTGMVVLVKKREHHFEIGLWLNQGNDASRARIVEQVCHIETYLKEKKYREGPGNLDPERVASEWIAKYAAGVPLLQDTDSQRI